MKEFIEYLVKQIVSKPEAVGVEETKEDSFSTYKIVADKDDMGVIIGKEGRTIRSIRNMAKAKAIKDNVRIQVDLEEND
ncbi:MAG: KH domain-containing protein [Patescibacteria group bacterium]|nr:KH domain-containing protein [Patescibacteria group bacterium]